MALGKGIGAQQHHGAGLGDGKRLANADRMGAHQIHLKFADLFARDANVAEFADSGGDGVRDAILRDQRIHHGARPIDSHTRLGTEQDGATIGGNFAHFFERQVVTVDVKSVQRRFAFELPGSKTSAYFPAASEILSKYLPVEEKLSSSSP